MYTDRQVKFLLSRFNNDLDLIKDYLNDLCSRETVESLASKYSTNIVQIQRDRNNFIKKNLSPGLLNKASKLLKTNI